MAMKRLLVLLVLLLLFCGIMLSQNLNRQMAMDSVWESSKLNVVHPDRALIIIHSQVPNLKFDEPNKDLTVEQVGSGDWNIYLTPGTARLKINAEGFQQLELSPKNFQRKQTYELKIVALGFAAIGRADENLFEITFQLNQDSVYASHGNLTPILSKSNSISFKVPKGEYTFHFQKSGFSDEMRTIKVANNQETTIELSQGISSASGLKLPGITVIQSEPSGAEIVINGQKIGNTPYQGELVAGQYQLEIRRPLYYPDASAFDLKEGETKELNRILKPKFGYLTVTSAPLGGSVYLDEKLIGTTPIENREIESIRHSLKVQIPMYHDYSEEFQIKDGESKTVSSTMKPAFGSLEILSSPEDEADVYVDGNKVGKTPYSNNKFGSGKYIIHVTKTLFNDVEEEVTVSDGLSTRRTLTLGKNFGELNISAPEDIILINGQRVGTNSYNVRLLPGKYTVRAERSQLYTPDEKEVFLAIGERKELTLEAKPRLGSLSVYVEPFDARNAEIFVNNELKGKAPIVLPLIMGTHSIMARKDDFLDKSDAVTIVEGEQQKMTLTMLTYEGSRQASINAWGRSKWISTGVAVLAGVSYFYSRNQSDSYYDKYRLSATPADAVQNRNQTTKFNTIAGISIGVGIGSVVGAITSWIWQGTY